MNLKKLFENLFNKNKAIDQMEYEFFKNVDIFSNLNKSEIQKLIDLTLVRNFKARELIFREKYPHVVLYIIKSGQVNLYLSIGREKITVKDLTAKDHFGEIGVFVDTARIVSAVATVDTELIALKHSDLRQYIKTNPAAGIKILYNLGRAMSSDLTDSYLQVKDYETKKQNS